MLSVCFFVLIYVSISYCWQLKNYNPKANPASIISSKVARFTVLTENLIRLEYDPNGIFEDRATFTIVNRYSSKPQFTSSNSNNVITITTSALTLTYQDGNEFNPNSLTIAGDITYNNIPLKFSYKPSGHGPSMDNSLSRNLFGTIRSLDEINSPISLNCTENANKTVHDEELHCTWSPFGRDGYALIDDSNTTILDNNWIPDTLYNNNNKQDWYFFAHGLNYKLALKDFALISGNHPLAQRYILGSMHCRWYDYSDLSIKQVVNSYKTREIPLDVMVIDMDWHLYGSWGSYTYNTDLFPFYNLTQKWFKNNVGLRTAANVHDANGIGNNEMYYKQAASALNVSNGKSIPFNVTSQSYMEVLMDTIQQPISQQNDLGVDGWDFWWIDWQQGGTNGVYRSNINPTILLNYVRATNHIRRNENIRGLVLARYGGYGNQRYPFGFSGDVGHNWNMLEYEVYFTSTAANVGYEWSHDIMGNANDNELDTRWIQWGAYSPLFRTHDAGSSSGGCANSANGCALVEIPQHYWKNLNIEIKALQHRAELLPYLYNASYELFTDNIQLTRPMYYEYPEDNNAYNTPFEYMLGNNLIVSPVTKSSGDGGIFKLTQQDIWIPSKGVWYEYHSGYYYGPDTKNGMLTRWMDLSEVPIYMRCSSIISIQPHDSHNIIGRAGNTSYSHLRWDIYPTPNMDDNINNRQTILYEDDGYTMNYLNNTNTDHVMTQFNWNIDNNNNLFTATIKSSGNYNGFNPDRRYSIRIYNVLTALTVSCNGNKLTYNKLYYDNYNEENIWYYDGKDMSITVNCASTNAMDSTTISIQFEESWINNMKLTAGIKGRINRAVLCKQSLDEANVNYGTDRVNLTDVAGYSTMLGYIGDNYNLFKNYIMKFDDLYNSAVKQVEALNVNSVGQSRLQYCINLVNTIYQ